MAFFDWNHDGKNNYIDNAIEMMILDDIEADSSQPRPVYGKRRKKRKVAEVTEEDKRIITTLGKIYFRVFAALVVGCTALGLIIGGYTPLGIVASIGILLWYGIKLIKRKKQK